jgi:hypothetical protein
MHGKLLAAHATRYGSTAEVAEATPTSSTDAS